MRIGYACMTVGVPGTQQRTCTLKNASQTQLQALTRANLSALDHMLDYNRRHGIRLLRISSDIVPFASHPQITFHWEKIFTQELTALGEKARHAGIRLSMHPGQYTVLNSPDPGVVERAVADLTYHCHFLDALEMGPECKIILHVGGAYGDKKAALSRFIANYHQLSNAICRRLVMENDDKIYSIEEVLQLGKSCGIPVVFDNLHHAVHPGMQLRPEREWITLCGETWHATDGPQKLHYSQQAPGKKPGSHSDTISVRAFMDFAAQLPYSCDIMLEVKDKNLSAVKCILATDQTGTVRALENEWGRYKYAVLERAPDNYQAIQTLLKNKTAYPVLEFYDLIEQAMCTPSQPGKAENAALHIWDSLKDRASQTEQVRFNRLMTQYRNGNSSLTALKRCLLRLAEKYHQSYLLYSLYFSNL